MVELAWPLALVIVAALAWDAYRRWLARNTLDLADQIKVAKSRIQDLIHTTARVPEIESRVAAMDTQIRHLETLASEAKRVSDNASFAALKNPNRRIVR